MTRRQFLQVAGAIGAGIDLGEFASGADGAFQGATREAEEITLADRELLVGFDIASGALTRLLFKKTGWLVQARPELAVSFRLHAPLPHRRDNFVLGKKQRAAKVERQNGNQVRIEWSNLESEHGGNLAISLLAMVTLRNGVLTFEATLQNESSLTVETIDYPYLGDLSAPNPQTTLWRRHMWYANLETHELYPHFNNEYGYWGIDFPLQTADASGSLYCLILAKDQGLYVDQHDPAQPYFVQFTFEQRPGNSETIGNAVPIDGAIAGRPSHLEFRTTHFIFSPPKSRAELSPVSFRCYRGDWQAGVDIYKDWRSTWFKKPNIPDWAQDVHSWQQLQINSPEEEFRIPYRELPAVGEECARHGVKAIQLVGWNHGGQDRGNPSQDTDPGLGTQEELHDAIAKIQAMGVKVILFGKFPWADKTTNAYKENLRRYATKDPYGEPYESGGYNYHTPTQLAGINTRRFAVMCTKCAEYREHAANEFKKIAALEPAGFLYDEVCHHGGVKYCFDPDHGHPVPAYVYAGDPTLFEALQREVAGREFLFSGEGPQDVLMQSYPFSYFRIDDGSTPICRYIDSQAPLMVAVTGYDDREMLNRVLMYRYVISYEPLCFKGRLEDFPLTLEYGKKIDALRRRYRQFLWDGEYRDTLGARVMGNGSPHRLYSVFKSKAGLRAVVVVNQDSANTVEARVDMPNAGSLIVATPETPDSAPCSGAFSLPPRSAAVVMEA